MHFVLFLLIPFVTEIKALSNATKTEITAPVNGMPLNSSILDTSKSVFVITAIDSNGNSAGDSELFWSELKKENSCEIGYGSVSCQVLCYPFNAPHVRAKQCESSYYAQGREEKTADTGLWVLGNVESSGASTYTVSYAESVEISERYIVSVTLLVCCGLYARYWDNLWFAGIESYSEIASEINYQWGTDATITPYGTDYISIRWQGKILPPYNETYKFYLFSDDGSRLWIDKQLIIDQWDECCDETWGSVNLTANTFHDIIVEYKEIRAEAYIELRWSSNSISKSIVPSTYLYSEQHIKDSPFAMSPIYISPGNVSYQQTVVNDEDPFMDNICGVNNSVYLTATDAFGHVLNTDTAIFNITNLDGMTSTQEWQGNGIYKITFMSITKIVNGTQFFIQLNNNHILNSPYTVYVKPSVTSPLNSTVSGQGLVSSVAGFAATFNITLFDIYGNERDSGSDIVTVRFHGAAAGHATCEYSRSGTGTHLCLYTLTESGIYTPEITVNDVVLSYSLPINVSAGIIHGPTCDISNINQVQTTLSAGQNEHIIIQARDQFGNPLLSSNSEVFIVNISNGVTTINSSILSIGSGQYNLSFLPLITSAYTVNILFNNETHIFNSPYFLAVTASDPIAANSYVVGVHSSAVSNVETSFVVQVCDSYENNVTDTSSAPFGSQTLVCANMNVTMRCIANGVNENGQYKCLYTPIESGVCVAYLTIAGAPITPWNVEIFAGEISSVNSYMYDSDNSAFERGIAGITKASFRIVSQDINGNNLTQGGGEYSFISSLIDRHSVHSDVVCSISDNMDGTYQIQFETRQANVYSELNVKLLKRGGLTGVYFSDYAFTNTYDTVIDPIISFDWGHQTPLPMASLPISDYFSIEWFGYLCPPHSETYTIYTSIYGGTGLELYLSHDLLIDQFDPFHGQSEPFIVVQLTANTLYEILIRFREQTGRSKISLEWQSNTIQARRPIDSQYLYYKTDVHTANISIIPSHTFAQSCAVENLESIVIAGQQNQVTIIAKDMYDNIQTNAGDEQALFDLYLHTIDGVLLENGTLSTVSHTQGQYMATYSVTNASVEYLLYVTYNGINVNASPFAIRAVANNISVTQSSATLNDGRAGEFQIFSLFVRDLYANPIGHVQIILLQLQHVLSGTVITTNNVTHNSNGNGNGEYIITYNTTLAGQYSINLTLNERYALPNSGTLNISTAIASPSKSYVMGWESGASQIQYINTSNSIEKRIQLIDIYSNPISDDMFGYNFYVTVSSASASAETPFFQQCRVNKSNGTYVISFSLPSAGIYYLSVLLASGDKHSSDGLFGEYFNNRWLYDTPYNTQIDTNLSLNWAHNLITDTAKDFVSIRWSGYIEPLYAETYWFTIVSDDGSRLYLNRELIFDHFLNNAGVFNGSYTFSVAHLLYPITVEYRENTGNANITLQWQSASQLSQIIPQSVLFSSASHIKSSPFTLIVT